MIAKNHMKLSFSRFEFKIATLVCFLLIVNINVGICAIPHRSKPDLETMIHDWAESYLDKIDSSYFISTNFKVENSDEAYNLTIENKNFKISEGLTEDAFGSFTASLKQYRKIYNGEMTAFTSVASESWGDKTPLNFEPHQPMTSKLLNEGYFFIRRFFNTSPNDRIILEKEKARIVHGAYVIPMFYQTSDNMGLRSAWYLIEKGQKLNKQGDTNPFPQYFLIIEGKGLFNNGDKIIDIKKDEAYFIPPDTEHIFWNESNSPLILVYMAWGQGA